MYKVPFERAGRRCTQASAQPLSIHVEAGRLNGPLVEADLKRIMKVHGMNEVDTFIPGCTHYPALGDGAFRNFLKPGAAIVDPADACAEFVHSRKEFVDVLGQARSLAERNVPTRYVPFRKNSLFVETPDRKVTKSVSFRYMTSGDKELMRAVARRAWGITIEPHLIQTLQPGQSVPFHGVAANTSRT